MNASALALLVYAAWTLLLVAGIAALRTRLVWRGLRRANSFAVSGDDVSPFSGRLCRAHANCVENLPVFVGLLAAAQWSQQGAVTDALALPLVAARLGQSCTHLVSIRNRAVILRFAFLAIQIAIQAWWVVALWPGLLRAA